ncbi:MAG TPA: response regulator [Candidatus Paceibacterota bacterium]|nr:response regulator [Candidatus Paceibacterota bacterium]
MKALATILLVDDEPEIISLYRQVLTKAGYEVRIATDGPAALEAVKEELPSLMLLDVKMPDMDGLEVLAKLKMTKEYGRFKVVFLTAYAESNIAGLSDEALKELGAAGVMQKGMDIHEFVNQVKGYLAE